MTFVGGPFFVICQTHVLVVRLELFKAIIELWVELSLVPPRRIDPFYRTNVHKLQSKQLGRKNTYMHIKELREL